MAFDQTTRNRLQSFVSKARAILSEEFTRQLQATYGLDPKQGTIADIGSLSHLDNYQLQTAHILRETVQHYMTTTAGKIQKEQVKQVLERIVREQAFTVLNRLAALRMAEARGFLLESIGSGYSSQGFQLYQMLEDGSHGETGDAYQSYLFSLFDEFGLDLAVLFDRFSVQGRLFPRETALLQLLEQINDYEIEPLWAEDETIGWIYQYFNSQEERKKMRSESSAPRNSRELAVRNQFFTPRYVVEFLTDNTLGRIWYEMTKGDTALVDSCQYLVKRPNEVFLSQGENSPIQNESSLDENLEALTQEEILKQPVYIPSRPLKDPRTIRMLDPACGSMHFGLYAFDLFEHIYLESWQIEAEQGADVFELEADLVSLHSTFGDIASFKQQIPKLIIEHNIHGVDIDPRAVQIAGLSLWQRAQRAWHEQGVKPNQRPTIVKSNIVCAEPMPGEQDLLKEFTSTLNPPALGQLVEVIFEKMALAGEAGTLLKIEQEIESAISKARQQWDETKDVNGGIRDLFEEELLAATPQKQLGFDLSGIDDETFWEDAEQLILQSLKDYSEQATSAAGEKRLFAEDAAKGFAFIDLSRKRFDAVLMNPPFGATAKTTKSLIDKQYSESKSDIFCCFVDRGIDCLSDRGLLASISNRTAFYLSGTAKWRELIMGKRASLKLFADLGDSVLDTALVETAAYTISRDISDFDSPSVVAIRCVDSGPNDKGLLLKNNIDQYNYKIIDLQLLKEIPGQPFAYWIGNQGASLFKAHSSLNDNGYTCKQGVITADDERFLRLKWELNSQMNSWRSIVKGGDYALFYSPTYLAVRSENDFLEIDVNANTKYPYLKGNAAKMLHLNNEQFESEGIYYTRRTSSEFSCRILPKNTIYSDKGPAIQPIDGIQKRTIFEMLAICNSDPFRALLSTGLGAVGNAARSYETGLVSSIPLPVYASLTKDKIEKSVKTCIEQIFILNSINENEVGFSLHKSLLKDEYKSENSLEQVFNKMSSEIYDVINIVKEEFEAVNELIWDSYSIKRDQCFTTSIESQNFNFLPRLKSIKSFAQMIISLAMGLFFKRWNFESNNNLFTADEILTLSTSNFQNNDLSDEGEYSSDSLIDGVVNWLYFLFPQINDIQTQLIDCLNTSSIEEYMTNTKLFFGEHLKEYSASRRQAPIYWPLQTASGSYTLWVYYHRLNSQTLYSCVNDFVEPKLALVTEDLNALSNKSNRSSIEEKELTKLTDLQNELKDFRDELLRLAKIWKPNLNDGVQITAAPLWKLFQHTAWQKKLKETWEKLEEGEYDWAHLAASIWPDRVLRKCHQDRSIAIAHDVEDLFWQEVEVPVMRGKKPTGKTKLEWQPIPACETTLNDMVNEAKARLQ